MRRAIIPILFFFTATHGVLASEKTRLNLELWFDPENRANIGGLHQHLQENNVENLMGYDFTTIWRIKPFNVEVKGRKIIWAMSTSQKDGVGCCYFPAGGLIFEVGVGDSAAKFADQLSCNAREDEIALDWLSMKGDSEEGKQYSAIICHKSN